MGERDWYYWDGAVSARGAQGTVIVDLDVIETADDAPETVRSAVDEWLSSHHPDLVARRYRLRRLDRPEGLLLETILPDV